MTCPCHGRGTRNLREAIAFHLERLADAGEPSRAVCGAGVYVAYTT
jgi:hypothetical protein